MKLIDLQLFFKNHRDPIHYEERKKSSTIIDKLIGYEIDKVEQNVQRNKDYENWSHIGCDRFSTPYEECIEIFSQLRLKKDAILIDLGAAYGRWGIIFELLFPQGIFIGYEIESLRVIEGNRIFKQLGLVKAKLYEKDIRQISLPKADVYIIYDFGMQKDLVLALEQMKQFTHSFILIARGGSVRKLIEINYPWLQNEQTKHETNYSLYFKQ